MTDKRVSEIEDAVAAGTMSAAQVFTQMRQLLPAAGPAGEDGKELVQAAYRAWRAADAGKDDPAMWKLHSAMETAFGTLAVERQSLEADRDALRGELAKIERDLWDCARADARPSASLFAQRIRNALTAPQEPRP